MDRRRGCGGSPTAAAAAAAAQTRSTPRGQKAPPRVKEAKEQAGAKGGRSSRRVGGVEIGFTVRLAGAGAVHNSWRSGGSGSARQHGHLHQGQAIENCQRSVVVFFFFGATFNNVSVGTAKGRA